MTTQEQSLRDRYIEKFGWMGSSGSFQGALDERILQFIHQEVEQAKRERDEEVKKAVAEYMSSEGCRCCEGDDHGLHKDHMCSLLSFPRYEDDSGWDYQAVLSPKQ